MTNCTHHRLPDWRCPGQHETGDGSRLLPRWLSIRVQDKTSRPDSEESEEILMLFSPRPTSIGSSSPLYDDCPASGVEEGCGRGALCVHGVLSNMYVSHPGGLSVEPVLSSRLFVKNWSCQVLPLDVPRACSDACPSCNATRRSCMQQ